MKKILVCLIAHDYFESFKDVLAKNVPIFEKYQMDLLILDSSEDVCEKRIYIDLLKEKHGLLKIELQHVPQAIKLEEKLQILFKRNGIIDQYEYVWSIGQRRIISDTLCERIIEATTKGCDFITIFNDKDENVYTRDKSKYFSICAEQSIMLGAAIYKNAILKSVDLDNLFDYYTNDDPTTFYQMSIYFECISRLTDFVGGIVHSKDGIMLTPVGAGKYWEKYRFYTWAETFPPFVYKLPDCYKGKEEFVEEVQKSRFNISKRTAIECIKLKSLDYTIFVRYKEYFKKYAEHFWFIRILVCFRHMMV